MSRYEGGGEWDFRDADTKEFTHCFHNYPAMMIPQIARKLIEKYGKKGGVLFDPYCGTGTSLVEARIAGMNSVGTDINPTARMISLSKTRNYNIKNLKRACNKLLSSFEQALDSIPDYSDFSEPDAVSWARLLDFFPNKTIAEIAFVLQEIEKETYKTAQQFLRVSLSECLRSVSYNRNNEFKTYRIPEKERKTFYLPLFPKLKETILRNISGVESFSEEVCADTKAWVKSFNTVSTSARTHIPGSGANVDVVVTSPPYGDSETTVAYAQYSWLTNVWLGLDDRPAGNLDSDMMGGRSTPISIIDFYRMIRFGKITEVFEKIFQKHEDRAGEVMQFYYDYYLSIKNVAKEVKQGGYVCYVVGNRTVKGEQLPTDVFTAWAFEQCGFTHETTFIRGIPNKRMPSKNSPSNVSGETSSTMNNEFIVICRKE